MIEFSSYRNVITKNLKAITGITTIMSESNDPQPPYPFIGLKFTTIGEEVGRETSYIEGTTEFTEQDIEIVLSVTSYSDKLDVSADTAYKAYTFFKKSGVDALSDNHIVVVKIEQITNRDTFINIDYERRHGFDVRLRVRGQLTNEVTPIEALNI